MVWENPLIYLLQKKLKQNIWCCWSILGSSANLFICPEHIPAASSNIFASLIIPASQNNCAYRNVKIDPY